MISIVMSASSINIEAAQHLTDSKSVIQTYPELDLSDNKEKEITFIELTADGAFQTLVHPKLFAEYLITRGLPIEARINFIISDMCMKHSMFTFAQELCNFLHDKERLVSAQVVGDLSYITFLNPPTSNHKNWQVYGIRPIDYNHDLREKELNIIPRSAKETNKQQSNEMLSHTLLMRYDKKKQLWEGNSPWEWIATSKERVIMPQSFSFFAQKDL